ncbi:acyl-CoA synthetase (AMP-forming)/AMP-acid ligase II [Actinokineospora spheciospongiae]|nr:acyl-CoA synthetase (AMP-forming)/AMP-acid ligase II [Actinokineospora spheciospongiae]
MTHADFFSDPSPFSAGEWVDTVLLAGDPGEVCLRLVSPVDRAALRAVVGEREAALRAAGLGAGGTVALRLPPSLEFVAVLLAGWRIGAQVALLDHRLTEHEVAGALDRVAAQFVVGVVSSRGHRLCGYAEVVSSVAARPGGLPARTPHALVQFSSGSTGASKVIARTAGDLVAELDRYDRLPGFPRRGERVVVLASVVHVLGLVGGLLNGLHAGAELVFPRRLTAEGILAAVAGGDTPATVLGVPFHAELLTSGPEPAPVPLLRRMVVAGELVRPEVPPRFRERFGVPLGTMYGMTEVGVIATDLDGDLWPAVRPAHGVELKADGGELWLRVPASPYLGLADPTRFVDGWLRTRDAGAVDPGTGDVTVLGRLDSQISVGGLKVDLTEVEQILSGVDGVAEAVVLFDGTVRAYLVLSGGGAVEAVEAALAGRLAAFKRPRELVVLPVLPRTATGKIVRDPVVLRAARDRAGAVAATAAQA